MAPESNAGGGSGQEQGTPDGKVDEGKSNGKGDQQEKFFLQKKCDSLFMKPRTASYSSWIEAAQ